MADNDKRKIDIPWATLLPLAAILAGVIVQYKPLVSERPSVPSEKTAPFIAQQDVVARLWQDPIGVAQKMVTLVDAEIKESRVPQDLWAQYDVSALAELLRENASKFRVLLLAVMLD